MPARMHCVRCGSQDNDLATARAERDALRAEIERLRGALRKYGRHVSRECGVPQWAQNVGDIKYIGCTCGLDAALGPEPGKEPSHG